MQTDTARLQKSPVQPNGLYGELMSHAAGSAQRRPVRANDRSQMAGVGALPSGLGLDEKEFCALADEPLSRRRTGDPLAESSRRSARIWNATMCSACCSSIAPTGTCRKQWMAEIVTTACMANDHLWQDLGLWSREYLSRLMKQNFPALAAKNVHDMKWKKFLYKQLCEQEGINACRAPSCEYCADYLNCFGPED